MDARLLIISLLVSLVSSEIVRKKICKDADTSTCSIHNVEVEPCTDGPAFCLIRRNKPYQVTVDFTPHFSANNLKLVLNEDSSKDGSFSTVVSSPVNVCGMVNCPLEKNVRQSFNTTLSLTKRSRGKFPVQVKLWNEDNVAEVCCFTFNVRMLK